MPAVFLDVLRVKQPIAPTGANQLGKPILSPMPPDKARKGHSQPLRRMKSEYLTLGACRCKEGLGAASERKRAMRGAEYPGAVSSKCLCWWCVWNLGSCRCVSNGEECVMYCDHCGSSLSSTSRFCSSCGKPVTPSAYIGTTVAPPEDRVHRHVHRLAILWVVNGVLRLMLVLGFFGAGRYFTLPNFGRPRIWALPFWHSQVWGSILLVLALFGVAHLVLAWGLFERQPWARYLGIILGILALVRFPLGTALGIYTLWVLAPEASGREYQQLSQPGYLRQA